MLKRLRVDVLLGLDGGLRLLLTMMLVEGGSGCGGEMVDVRMWIMESGGRMLCRRGDHGQRRVVGREVKGRRLSRLRMRFGLRGVFSHMGDATARPVRCVSSLVAGAVR